MFKKHKLVLIKTNQEAEIGATNFYLANSKTLVIDRNIANLYVISELPPKKGDWNIFDNRQITQSNVDCISDEFKKIVATTDKYLTKEMYSVSAGKYQEPLSQIPEFFINYFIQEYSKGNLIEEVMVECNEGVCKCDTMEKAFDCCFSFSEFECRAPNPNNDFYGLFPKVNVDNTVNIQIPKVEFTREEHIAGIKRMIQLYETTYLSGDIDKWILENL